MLRVRGAMNTNFSYDLFGEVPVTWPDVELWVFALVGLTRESPRWQYYVKYWNVADKIRSAKFTGSFDAAIADGRFAADLAAAAFLPVRCRRMA